MFHNSFVYKQKKCLEYNEECNSGTETELNKSSKIKFLRLCIQKNGYKFYKNTEVWWLLLHTLKCGRLCYTMIKLFYDD
jgi:hypothetical protein